MHPALRLDLRTALFRAGHQHINVTTGPILFNDLPEEETPHFVTIHVRPMRAADGAQEFLLVIFESTTEAAEIPVQAVLSPDCPAHVTWKRRYCICGSN